ncbi:MAG TPA: DUF4342 domain-containing protein [Syntrophomonadaceae bacterium]|nr:DUF4342 domain-containing protein [Syntrophomonadaceae bacterium]
MDFNEKKGHWSEKFDIAASELIQRIKELIQEGNVNRIIIRNARGRLLLEIPVTGGVAVGSIITILSPVLAVLGFLAALMARVQVEVIRHHE